jgi:hypothetical protein
VIPKSGFKIISGDPTTYEVKGDSGNLSLRKFCGTCSSTMWTESESFPSIIVVKAGIMDDGAIMKFAPGTESFTSRKPGWIHNVDGATQFAEAYKS